MANKIKLAQITPEEIVTKLRQVEVLTGQGMPRLDAMRQIGVTEQTHYRWSAGGIRKASSGRFPRPNKYGGMGADHLKRLRQKNERLGRAVPDLTLDKLILAEAAQGNY